MVSPRHPLHNQPLLVLLGILSLQADANDDGDNEREQFAKLSFREA